MAENHRLSKGMRALEKAKRKPIEDILRALYYGEGLTLNEMEARLGVPAKTLHGWMVRLGINQRAMAEQAAKELTA